MFPDLKADYIISKKQIDQFWEAGFILLKEVLNKDEIKYYGKVIRDNAKKRIHLLENSDKKCVLEEYKEWINDGLNKHTVLLLRDDPII